MRDKTGEKGSGLKIRVISGVVIGVLLAAMLVSRPVVTAVVLFMLSVTAYRELANVTGFSGEHAGEGGGIKIGLLEGLGYLGIAIHYLLMIISRGDLAWFAFSAMVVFCCCAIAYVMAYPAYSAAQFAAAVFSFMYAPMMLSCIYLLRILPGGNYLGWVPFVAWICDTCAYFVGRAFGKHKLCPKLSPHKTVEGAVGGVIGCMIAGVVFGFVFSRPFPEFELSYMLAALVIITAAGGILAQVGDLTASGIKRYHDVKDYGKIIPGHGGIMDRFDSVIFISPFMYFLASFLLHGGFVR